MATHRFNFIIIKSVFDLNFSFCGIKDEEDSKVNSPSTLNPKICFLMMIINSQRNVSHLLYSVHEQQ